MGMIRGVEVIKVEEGRGGVEEMGKIRGVEVIKGLGGERRKRDRRDRVEKRS